MSDLIVIVPTRSRPMHVQRVVQAWLDTDAFHAAELCFVIDEDDPARDAYLEAFEAAADVIPGELMQRRAMTWMLAGTWRPLVPKLNGAAVYLRVTQRPYALGFAGDDHVPRTPGWARMYVQALRDGAGIVYGDDGYQHENLPTEWAMRTDIVNALGRMVPAPVDHLYCDNSIKDLGQATGLLRYLPEVNIEHLHPVAGKTETDAQYERVNGNDQYRRDRRAYREWHRAGGLLADAATVTALRKGETP
jgi:hypothetical protein